VLGDTLLLGEVAHPVSKSLSGEAELGVFADEPGLSLPARHRREHEEEWSAVLKTAFFGCRGMEKGRDRETHLS
jgi:hypothetical protein